MKLMNRVFYAFSLIVFVCTFQVVSAHAESPYPRDQVERHLRSMFWNFSSHDEVVKQYLPSGEKSLAFIGFDAFSTKKKMRAYFFDLKEEEIESVRAILKELFSDILEMPMVVVNPYEEEFDLLVYVSDDLPRDAVLPKYKSIFKQKQDTDQAYIADIRERDKSDIYFLTQSYLRKSGDYFKAIAVERLPPDLAEKISFERHMRYTLFYALTGAAMSRNISPSVTNQPDIMQKLDGYAPIDRAVLRVIFGHDDWPGFKYEQKNQLLTDRVMQELNRNP